MICLKSPKSSEVVIFLTSSGQTPYLCLFHHVLTTIQLNFKDIEIIEIKRYASSGIRTRNP